jgi:hypothetical protein
VPAAEEERPVGFEGRPADDFAIGDAQMRRPDFRLRGTPLSPRGDDRAELRKVFGLDEHFRKGRVSHIGALRPQSEFRI